MLNWACGTWLAVLVMMAAGSTAGAQSSAEPDVHDVARIYVEPFVAKPDSDKLRSALIAQLRRVHTISVVTDASAADATLSGDGEVWIKGYRSLNPRAGRLPSNGKPIHGGYLSVELTSAKGDTLWSYLASENASEDVFNSLSRKVMKQLIAALQSTDGQ